MRRQFVFFYFMKREPQKIKATVPLHIEYWHGLNLSKYQGGPFADRTGGLITFEADDEEKAISIIMKDPFVLEGLIEDKWIKEWAVE